MANFGARISRRDERKRGGRTISAPQSFRGQQTMISRFRWANALVGGPMSSPFLPPGAENLGRRPTKPVRNAAVRGGGWGGPRPIQKIGSFQVLSTHFDYRGICWKALEESRVPDPAQRTEPWLRSIPGWRGAFGVSIGKPCGRRRFVPSSRIASCWLPPNSDCQRRSAGCLPDGRVAGCNKKE